MSPGVEVGGLCAGFSEKADFMERGSCVDKELVLVGPRSPKGSGVDRGESLGQNSYYFPKTKNKSRSSVTSATPGQWWTGVGVADLACGR